MLTVEVGREAKKVRVGLPHEASSARIPLKKKFEVHPVFLVKLWSAEPV